MKKNITFNLYKTRLTLINGNNTICNNESISGRKIYEIDTDLSMTIKLKPDTFCDYSTIPQLNFAWNTNPAAIIHSDIFTQNNYTYELTTNFQYDFQINNNLVITLKAQATEFYGLLQTNLTNCVCNIQAGNLKPEITTFILTCENDYNFQITPSITYGGNVERVKDKMITDYFQKVNDTTFTFTITTAKEWLYIITAEAVKKSTVIENYGFISVYKLTNDDLQALAIKRFVHPDLKPVTVDNTTVIYNVNYEYIDTAKFIVALHRVNIPIITTEKQNVKFGPYDMQLDCNIIENNIIFLDFGSVDIIGIYNNAIDYENTEINIYLPFIGFVTLDSVVCMNKTISLKYQVNLLNGDSLALIYANENLISSHSCNIAVKIPYKMSDNEEINTQIEQNNNYLHNEQPFIITRTNNAISNDLLPYHDTNFYSILGDLSGYTEATEINFNVVHDFITYSEIEEIKSLINKGIII